MYDSIIIGGGISGLYIGYQLLQKGINNFIILEKTKYLGGRVYTNEEGLELGASIIHTRQKNIMKIIRELGLSDDLTELKGGKETLYCGNNYNSQDSEKVNNILEILNNRLKKYAPKNRLLSLQELCKKYLSEDDYIFFKDFTKEWFEIREQNANTYFESLENTGKICKLKNGLSQIINKFQKILKGHIKLETQIEDINFNGEKYILNNGEYNSKNLYLCTSVKAAKMIKYKGINMKAVLSMCKGISSLRAYYKFFDKNIIDKNIVGNHRFKWCIYISDRIVMGSYTDGQSASYLGNLGEKKASELILKELGSCLNKKITFKDVEKTYFAFWKEAFSIVKSYISEKRYNKILDTLPSTFHQTVCPLEYGINQAWMEAHLLKI